MALVTEVVQVADTPQAATALAGSIAKAPREVLIKMKSLRGRSLADGPDSAVHRTL